MSYHFAYCSWGSQGKNAEVVCHSLLQWTTFCQTSPPWPGRLGWPHTAWLSFIELDKAVVHVIRLASFLWLWFQWVCPLMPSCNTYRLTWVSLPLDVGYLFMAAPAKRSCCSLPQMRGILMAAPPDLECGIAPLGPPAPMLTPAPTPKFKSNLQNWEQVHKLGIDWSLFAYISVLVFRKDWLQIREGLDHCRLTCLGQYDLPSWKRKWQPTPVFLPGKFHGRRRLVGYSPWGHKESDMT